MAGSSTATATTTKSPPPLASDDCDIDSSSHRFTVNTRLSRLQKLAEEQGSLPPRPFEEPPYDPVYLYSSLVAGVGSGALASLLCAPIDLVRVRMQVWGQVLGEKKTIGIGRILKEIKMREGWKGFFRGLGATLLTVPAFWGVYFPLYDDLKRRLANVYPETNPSWIHMGSAVLSGTVSDVLVNPMFVIRTRLQTEALHDMVQHPHNAPPVSASSSRPVPKSIIQMAKALYLEGGAPIFWRGMTANLLGLSHVAVQFPCYEAIKKELRQNKRHESAIDLVLASSLSKMTASLLTYPHEVVRSRMMDVRASQVSLVRTCRTIYSQHGFFGFYAGLPVSLIRVLPNTCVTFLTYELLLRWARKKMQERKGI